MGRIKWQLHIATTLAKAPNKSLSLQFTDIRPIPISPFPMRGQLSCPADCALLLEQGSAARLFWQQMSPTRKRKMCYYIYLNSTLRHFGIGDKLYPRDEIFLPFDCHIEKKLLIYFLVIKSENVTSFCPRLCSTIAIVERGSSAVECRTRNQVSPDSNPPLVQFRRLGIFVLSIDAPVDSAV